MRQKYKQRAFEWRLATYALVFVRQSVSGVYYMLLVFHYYYVSPVGGSALL